ARDEEGIGPLALHTFESGIDLSASVSVENLDLQAHCTSSRFHLSQCRFGGCRIGRVDEHRDTRGRGQQLAQEFQPLCCQLGRENTDAGEVATRPGEARNKTNADRVITGYEDDWDCRRCRLGREYGRGSDRNDHGTLAANETSRKLRQPIKFILGPSEYDRYILGLDIAGLSQALAKCA